MNRLGRGDLKFSFTKRTQSSVSMRTVHDANSSGLRYRWHCDGKMESSGHRDRNVAPVEVRQDALRKSKPVTRWLLGNGNRKLVTQATPSSGVSRKREML